jgi:hypothetical protein
MELAVASARMDIFLLILSAVQLLELVWVRVRVSQTLLQTLNVEILVVT